LSFAAVEQKVFVILLMLVQVLLHFMHIIGTNVYVFLLTFFFSVIALHLTTVFRML